ncbi:Cof-type HAD-IIB family hydrolase [Gottfriedia acidiceleris]|uniref:Cof-type HAD-IIB family hydrolase n=1 Tax=Gottfriedia acidiceleris TaxID=371036 RepID=A0ABY4JR53_9BACI|nr:Cof-type HAD-IIB family hydrolase [Gottfriedia acidiceleris]UPM56321.1 Cof-type HAD-IIB family hydrolase [Gottfriedia acidiceleris]
MKLIALDLDGTTLNSKKIISEETLNSIKKAQVAGNIVMILSGRSPSSVYDELLKYGLNCPVGGHNGTELYVNGKLIELNSLGRPQVQKIALNIEKEDLPYNVSNNKGIFAPRNWNKRFEQLVLSGRVPKEYFSNRHFKMFTTPPNVYGHSYFSKVQEIIDNEDFTIQKFLILTLDPKQMERLEKKLRFIDEIFVTSASPFNLEVTHINGNKGYGLKAMASYFNIPLENTVAIGDEKNDLPMFNIAGLSIAMGNAEEEVKLSCDVVTLSNDENGVAYAFEKYIFKESNVL